MPACIRGLVAPGAIGPGPYTTQWFFGGQMHVTLEGNWTSNEDSTGEFNAMPQTTPQNAIFFWEDVYPIEEARKVSGVPVTSAGLLHWFQATPRLETSAPHSGKIGDLPATVVDVSVSRRASNEDSTCPNAWTCILFLGFDQWTNCIANSCGPPGAWGIGVRPSGSSQVQRFYLADVKYGGQRHLFVAVVYPDKASDMESFSAIANEVLRSVRVPATPA